MHHATQQPIRKAISKHSIARVEYLFGLLNAKSVEPNQWRMPGGTIVHGELKDFVRSVDHVKQLEDWVVSEEVRLRGYSEYFLEISSSPPLWDAVVRDVEGRLVASSDSQTKSEALARLEALIAYVAATNLVR